MKHIAQEEKTTTYFGYSRKSSEDNKERQAQSIESQEKDLNRITAEQNLDVPRFYSEEKSAHVRGRAEFGKMIEALENGDANAVLTWHPNRLARNPYDAGLIITLMDEGVIREIKTPHRTYRNTPDDKFYLMLEFGISKKDSDDKSVVVKRGLLNKCDKGWMPGVAPLGYLNTPEVVGGSRYIKKDEERFELVKKMWTMMASGQYSVVEIQKIMTDKWGFKTRRFKRQGGKPIAISVLYKVLNDPFYYGAFEYPRGSGTFYKGEHEAMITQEVFDIVQNLLNRPVRAKPHTKDFAFTGLCQCGECGGQITASEKLKHQKNGKEHHYIYYHCTKRKKGAKMKCSQPHIREHELETQMMKVIDSVTIPPQLFTLAMQWFREENAKEAQGRNIVLDSQQRAYTICVKKLDGLIDMRAAQEITEAEFKAKKAELLQEKQKYENLLKGTAQRADNWLELAEDVFAFARDVKQKFETGNWQVKKSLLQILGSKFVLTNKKLDITLNELLFPVPTIIKEAKKQDDWLEPPTSSINTGENADLRPISPTLLRGQDSDLLRELMGLPGKPFPTLPREVRRTSKNAAR